MFATPKINQSSKSHGFTNGCQTNIPKEAYVHHTFKHNKWMQKWSKGNLIHVKGLAFKPMLFEF
jgi:hypothetical protein